MCRICIIRSIWHPAVILMFLCQKIECCMYKNIPAVQDSLTHTRSNTQTYHFKTIWLFVCMLYFYFKSALCSFFFFFFFLSQSVQNSSNQSKPLPSTIHHDQTTALFQPCITQKVKNAFRSPQNILFHTRSNHVPTLWIEIWKQFCSRKWKQHKISWFYQIVLLWLYPDLLPEHVSLAAKHQLNDQDMKCKCKIRWQMGRNTNGQTFPINY